MKVRESIEEHTTFETPCGTCRFSLTSGTHVYIQEADRQYLTVPKGVGQHIPHHIGFHLYLQEGKWVITSNVYICRMDTHDAPTKTCENKIRRIIVDSWNEFISTHPELVKAAANDDLNERIENIKGKIETKQDEIAEWENELANLLASRADLFCTPSLLKKAKDHKAER